MTASAQNLDGHPHRRRNPLTGDWVLVSPHRTERPWRGEVSPAPPAVVPAYDPVCSLCPGNTRAGGVVNDAYDKIFVFENDYSALLPTSIAIDASSDPLFAAEGVQGTCRVICFSPRHDLALGKLPRADVLGVIDAWARESDALGERHTWVQIFENKGAAMGSSSPHPHGQIWASTRLPNEPLKEDSLQRAYFGRRASPLLVDYAAREVADGDRVVDSNDAWVAVVPYWAIWPFETLIIPRRAVSRMSALTGGERGALTDLLQRLLARYDGLFDAPFPYSMGWHAAPYRSGETEHFQLHAHVYPPLLRSATVRKHMVGYELLAEPQRDLTPETAARRLRAVGLAT